MKNSHDPAPSFVLELFQPHPETLYGLDAAAHLAGVPRRSLLVYCCAGLVQPVFEKPYGIMVFDEKAIHTARLIDLLQTRERVGLGWIKNLLALMNEVEKLRIEVEFLRGR